MSRENPYAMPQSALDDGSPQEQAWREDKLVVMRLGGSLPCRCIKCNAAADTNAKMHTVYWHSPWLYLTILLNILIYVIVAMLLRKRAKINPALCQHHRRRRLLGQFGAVLAMAVGIFLLIHGATEHQDVALILGILFILLAIIVAMAVSRLLTPTFIDEQVVKLRGAKEAFLESLPRR